MSARRFTLYALLIAASGTTACGILIDAGADDSKPTTTPPSSGGADASASDDAVVETSSDVQGDAAERDAAAADDANAVADADAGVDAGGAHCPACASGECPMGVGLCDPLVFVTSEDYAGDFSEVTDAGGIDRLDVACNRSAEAAGIVGTYKAWVSESSTNADPSKRLNGTNRPFRRRDGVIVEPSFGAFETSNLEAPISKTASGADLLGANVWTGTPSTLTNDPRDCSGWTSPMATTTGIVGVTTCPTFQVCEPADWTFRSAEACNTRAHVYCFEQL